MATLINFSHPLNPDAKKAVRERYGVDKIVQVPFHLDTNKPIVPQVGEIVKQVYTEHGLPDYIIPPGYAPAAILVARLLSNARIIRLAAEPGVTPPKWMPVEDF